MPGLEIHGNQAVIVSITDMLCYESDPTGVMRRKRMCHKSKAGTLTALRAGNSSNFKIKIDISSILMMIIDLICLISRAIARLCYRVAL